MGPSSPGLGLVLPLPLHAPAGMPKQAPGENDEAGEPDAEQIHPTGDAAHHAVSEWQRHKQRQALQLCAQEFCPSARFDFSKTSFSQYSNQLKREPRRSRYRLQALWTASGV